MPDASGGEPPRQISPRTLRRAGIITALAAGAIVVVGVGMRAFADRDLKDWNVAQQIPTVNLAKIVPSGEQSISLPAQLQAFSSAPIHARVSGYLKAFRVDIGDKVKSGQVLAEVDTPDLDQQVMQARADLGSAQANESLAQTTSKRWADLLAQDAVSKQDADEKSGAYAARSAAVKSAQANLDRLLALESFKRITAPFDGIVTARSTDIGALISAGNPSEAPLFVVSDQRRIRIYVGVPQSYSGQLKANLPATVSVPEYPGKSFKAKLIGDSQSIDQRSGALLVQLQTDNADGALRPGSYGQVSFKLPAFGSGIRVPATAVAFVKGAPTLAIVGPDDHVEMRPIKIGRDLGSSIEVSAGLSVQDKVVDNPPELLANGDLVRIAGASNEKADGKAKDNDGAPG